MKRSLHFMFGTAATVIVLVAIAWGFFFAGSPMQQRLLRFDERRLSDLQTIRSELIMITNGGRWPDVDATALQSPIPATLEDVRNQAINQRPVITDPETQEPYGYRTVDAHTVELCATFTFPREEDFDPLWNHGEGRQCFPFDLLHPEDVNGRMKPLPVME